MLSHYWSANERKSWQKGQKPVFSIHQKALPSFPISIDRYLHEHRQVFEQRRGNLCLAAVYEAYQPLSDRDQEQICYMHFSVTPTSFESPHWMSQPVAVLLAAMSNTPGQGSDASDVKTGVSDPGAEWHNAM